MAENGAKLEEIERFRASWVDIFTNWTHLVRFLTFCAFCLAALLLVGYIAIHLVGADTFEVDENGHVKISGIGHPNRYLVLLPASVRWVDTGVELKHSQCADIRSSGSVHLSISGMWEAARQGHPALHGEGNGPDGLPRPPSDDKDARYGLLLAQDAPMGSVVAIVTNHDPHNRARPDGIFFVGKRNNCVSGEGKLWLSVNDWVIDRENPERTEADKKLYVSAAPYTDDDGTRVTPAGLAARWENLLMSKSPTSSPTKEHFIQVPQADARDPFFEDNIGDFLVEINVR